MSKAILILNEMPKSCDKCPIFNSDFYTCQLVFGELYEEARKGVRHENCPLRPLPKYEKLEESEIYISNNWQKIGWNNCLRNIIGEE